MTNQILDVNEALVAKILYDFDHQLQTRFKSSLFQFKLKPASRAEYDSLQPASPGKVEKRCGYRNQLENNR